jgi:undecaprenyl-diphosphatase
MNLFQSIVLGIVQGLTEFLPVSSSGHLVIIPDLFHWTSHTLVFDTTLHLGTSLALIVFFYKDIKDIVIAVISDFVLLFKPTTKKQLSFSFHPNSLLGFKLLVGCIPALILGLLFGDYLEAVFRDIPWVILFLTVGSVLMFFAEYFMGERYKTVVNNKAGLSNLSFIKALYIGIFQSLALFPGMSRSGSTISGGMFLGLSKEDSAKFSFLLSIPIILGAGVYQLISNPLDSTAMTSMLMGFLFSFLSGIIAIKFLLGFLKTNKLYPFVLYRVGLALFLLVYILL